MSVAKVIELTSTSAKSFEDAIQKGIARQNAQERRGRVDQGAESHRDGRQDQWLPRQHVGDFRARRGDVDLATFAPSWPTCASASSPGPFPAPERSLLARSGTMRLNTMTSAFDPKQTFRPWRLLYLMQINVVAKAIPHDFTRTEASALGARINSSWNVGQNSLFSRPQSGAVVRIDRSDQCRVQLFENGWPCTGAGSICTSISAVKVAYS